MIRLRGCEGQAGANILPIEIGKIGEYFGFAHSRCEKIEDILDPDAHAADARATAALVRIECDAIHGGEPSPRATDSKGSEPARARLRQAHGARRGCGDCAARAARHIGADCQHSPVRGLHWRRPISRL